MLVLTASIQKNCLYNDGPLCCGIMAEQPVLWRFPQLVLLANFVWQLPLPQLGQVLLEDCHSVICQNPRVKNSESSLPFWQGSLVHPLQDGCAVLNWPR